jgi:hypothetical protein
VGREAWSRKVAETSMMPEGAVRANIVVEYSSSSWDVWSESAVISMAKESQGRGDTTFSHAL